LNGKAGRNKAADAFPSIAHESYDITCVLLALDC